VKNIIWPKSMKRDVNSFVSSYRVFPIVKGGQQNKFLYIPLLVRKEPWIDISMDFDLELS
jgi:hypothetical protein